MNDLTPEERSELWAESLQWERYVAREAIRFLRSGPPRQYLEKGDLISAGMLGVCDAIRKRSPDHTEKQWIVYMKRCVRDQMFTEYKRQPMPVKYPLNSARRAAVAKNRIGSDEDDPETIDELENRPDRLDSDDLSEAMQAIGNLPADLGALILAHFGIAGPKQTLRAQGERLGITQSGVLVRIKRGLGLVRARLAPALA